MGGAVSAAGERRRSERCEVANGAMGVGRLVGAGPVRVLDLSRHGVALRARHRGVPGRAVALQWTLGDRHIRVPARVIRSRVVALHGDGGVEYAMGLEFAEPSALVWELATRDG